jgi:23S rRNA (cytidine1920-2'-O)/16S rRNA (cytidine1409-2'-O)-methyltransferase
VVLAAAAAAVASGFGVRGVTRSPLIGPAGNVEFLLWLAAPAAATAAIEAVVGAGLGHA